MTVNNNFLKATPLYKEYAILELLSKNSNISQRAIAKQLDSSLSMINQYLEDYEVRGLINRKNVNARSIDYNLTNLGVSRLRELNIIYLESIRKMYLNVREDIINQLKTVIDSNTKKILMYGAGDVAELTLLVLQEQNDLDMKILGIIDDDVKKQGKSILEIPIINRETIKSIDFDVILISSYSHRKKISENLKELNIDSSKIVEYF